MNQLILVDLVARNIRRNYFIASFIVVSKVLMSLITLSKIVSLYTNMDIMVSTIGLIGLAFYYLFLTVYEQKLINLTQISKRTTFQKTLLVLLFLLAINIKHLSQISLGIWMCFLVPLLINRYELIKQKAIQQMQLLQLLGILVLFIHWELFLFKYQNIIQIGWHYLSFLFRAIGYCNIILMGFVFYFTYYQIDKQQTQKSIAKHKQKSLLSLIPYTITTFLTFQSLFLSNYHSQNISIFLLALFSCNVIQVAIYSVFYYRLVLMISLQNTLMYSTAHFIRTRVYDRNFRVRPIDTVAQKFESFSQIKCFYCGQQAKIIHVSCNHLIFCETCYRKINLRKSYFLCPICKNTFSEYSISILYGPKDKIIQKINHYLLPLYASSSFISLPL